jgi:hypothetical protein
MELCLPTEERVVDWQWPLYGVHSITVVNSAQPGEGGGVRPPRFTLSTITSKVVAYAPPERVRHTPPISSSTLFSSVGLPYPSTPVFYYSVT